MKSYSSRELIRILKADGWYEVNCVGDHHQFKHPTKKGRVTITHPKKDLPRKTVESIFQQAGIAIPE
ncbi:type II toxin-antitoxin system HicA family toxin [uncultured Selenomonas sp.]|uniref:type II toxin-antitoxin system HicA family toxin n=1 Tax=uncultured Selenomonas sp. TaxID=159275 RepID=UPI0025E51DD0|nr:type II toxin-antitoxin system HicA family toxin [uncultured Selenomonas sp.]